MTGASSGIGRATAEFLASKGHLVFAGARREEDLGALDHLPNVAAVRLDVTREEDAVRAVAKIRDTGLGLYGLVNCAGLGNAGPIAEMTVEDLHQVMEVNLDGGHRMVHAVFPLLREARGRVVNISSIGGFLVETLLGPYNISKHAVEAYSDILREEVAPFGIRVVTITPGSFQTPIFDHGLKRFGESIRKRWVDSDSVYREQVLQLLTYLEQPEVRFRKQHPLPTAVASAIEQALFTEEPRKRYLVATPEEACVVFDRIFSLIHELNDSRPDRLTPEALAERLMKARPSSEGEPPH